MQILIDGRSLLENQRCGVGTYASEMVKALAAAETDELFVWGNGLKSDWPADLPLQGVKRSLTRRPNKLVNAGFSLLRRPRIEDHAGVDPDLIYLPNLNFMATDRPYVVTVHDLSFLHFPEFFPPKGRAWHRAIKPNQLIKHAAHVITVSEHTKQDLQELFGLKADEISVVSPGVGPEFRSLNDRETERTRRYYELPEEFFLFMGAIEPRKNIEGLISAFELIDAPEHLVIAGGKGWLNRNVYQQAATSPKRDKIHFLGYVSADDKPSLYNLATALVYPSFYEGFGMPPVEAMACGTPVIASHVSSLPEVVGQAGLLVNPHDLQAIAAAMESLSRDPAARAELRRRGLKRAQDFSWDQSAAKLTQTLRRLQPKNPA
jgi:glycosyltransferase involved in cell wall biosynthesis